MTLSKTIRYGAWTAVVVIAFATAFVVMYDYSIKNFTSPSSVGGPFNLVDGEGNSFTEQNILGKPTAIFFGFTHCPDVCPTTLAETQNWIDQLQTDADKMNFLFVTVDPERDTPAVMRDYVSSFDSRIVPLTGNSEQIEAMFKSYRVYARKVEIGDGEYTMDHTAGVYLMDSENKFKGMISYGEDPENALAKLRRLIDNI